MSQINEKHHYPKLTHTILLPYLKYKIDQTTLFDSSLTYQPTQPTINKIIVFYGRDIFKEKQ